MHGDLLFVQTFVRNQDRNPHGSFKYNRINQDSSL